MSRNSVNVVFGIVTAALGITAGTAIYQRSIQPEIQHQHAAEPPLPEKHPPVDFANRIPALEQLAARSPQNPDYPAQIANLYYDLGQYDKAAEYYQKSLNLRPQDPNVETDLATCLHYLGQEDRALEVLDRVLSYSPRFVQAKFNKGIVLIEGKKDVKGGIAVWEDLLRSEPAYSQRAELEQRIQQLKATSK